MRFRPGSGNLIGKVTTTLLHSEELVPVKFMLVTPMQWIIELNSEGIFCCMHCAWCNGMS